MDHDGILVLPGVSDDSAVFGARGAESGAAAPFISISITVCSLLGIDGITPGPQRPNQEVRRRTLYLGARLASKSWHGSIGGDSQSAIHRICVMNRLLFLSSIE